MTILDKKQMIEEDIKLNSIMSSLLSRGWKDKITMETRGVNLLMVKLTLKAMLPFVVMRKKPTTFYICVKTIL